MEIVDFGRSPGRTVEAYGSVGVTARALIRGDLAAVTVLQVAAGGEVGRHRAPVDQLMVVGSRLGLPDRRRQRCAAGSSLVRQMVPSGLADPTVRYPSLS